MRGGNSRSRQPRGRFRHCQGGGDSASVRADLDSRLASDTPKNRRSTPPLKDLSPMAFSCLSAGRALGTVALALALVAPGTVLRAQDSDPVVARANGVDIRQSDLVLAEDEI